MRTSYFARAGRHPNAIAISRGVPKWYDGARYLALAPSWALMKEARPEVFAPEYYRLVLSKLDPQKVLDDLVKICPEPILLCWEGRDQYCHRQEVAKWLKESLNWEMEELL